MTNIQINELRRCKSAFGQAYAELERAHENCQANATALLMQINELLSAEETMQEEIYKDMEKQHA